MAGHIMVMAVVAVVVIIVAVVVVIIVAAAGAMEVQLSEGSLQVLSWAAR